MYDYIVFIGRFQPFHLGHLHVLLEARKLAKKIIVCIGSASTARSPRNPFTYLERSVMIREAYLGARDDVDVPVEIVPIDDHVYNDVAWISEVQSRVNSVILNDNNVSPKVTLHGTNDFKVAIIGQAKDGKSDFSKKFPQWASVSVPSYRMLGATDIRDHYFRQFTQLPGDALVPVEVNNYLRRFVNTEEFGWITDYNEYCIKYRSSMEGKTPFEKAIICADAVVVQSGHILLVQRGAHPGKGQWALPGGHVNVKDETFLDAAIRELKEETHLSDDKGEIPPGMLASFIKREKIFDDANRSERGRVITNAFYFEIPERQNLLTVHADDDAVGAKWVKVSDLREHTMFEDHYHIIKWFLGSI